LGRINFSEHLFYFTVEKISKAVFMFAPCINSDEKSFIVPTDELNNMKPQI
jgi:hypothetical protein